MRDLVLVLGDQLSAASPAFDSFDKATDAVLMIEAAGEAEHVWSHKARIAIFLAAMRHFRDELRARSITVHYIALEDDDEPTLAGRLAAALERLRPRRLRLVEAGEWRVANDVAAACATAGVSMRALDDRHFFCSRADFARWAGPHAKSLRMEFFYREMRRTHGVLLDDAGGPEGGRWNFDADNRKGWPKSPPGRAGPGLIAAPERFAPDALTREVIALVERRFAGNPGALADFAWPVSRSQALEALDAFVAARLANFGEHQDAMWTATPFGWHSLLSSSLNLHLLDPREVVAAAEAAYRRGDASLASAEGFIRQILGWREFMRGIYWRDMPAMAEANHLQARRPLPAWYWTGATKMACAADAVGQTLRHGYAHHIQRLMVTGLFALLAGIDPKQVAAWYLAVYVDAVEWAELPNVASMALWADGGRFTSKPYVASGAYIDRMSNYCGGCAYAPTEADAARRDKPLCPYTVLYWNFLDRHGSELGANPRTLFMMKHLER
ncbi:MAG: cryptochrome/photolyase family protein, partial [Caldimonas sp.]